MAKKLVLKPYERMWCTNEGFLAFKSYLRIGESILCRVDLRIGDSDSYGIAHLFSGGWIQMAEADGSMLKCHEFKPDDNPAKVIAAMRKDVKALAEETQVVMAFGGEEGTPRGSEEENKVEKDPKGA